MKQELFAEVPCEAVTEVPCEAGIVQRFREVSHYNANSQMLKTDCE